MKVIIYNQKQENLLTEGDQMLKFQRLKLIMRKNGTQTMPQASELEKIMKISGIQTVKDSEGLVETKTSGSFIFWYSAHGYGLPITSELLVKDGEGKVHSKPNTRQPNEIEPKNQVFAFYDTEKDYFYLSDSRKQGYFEELFNLATADIGVTWEFLKVYKTAREFLATIRSIKKVTLVSEKDLFNQGDYDFPVIKNFGSASSYELNVDFTPGQITERAVWALEELTGYVKQGRYQKLICVGDAGGDLERVFNSETFVERIWIHVSKNESDGMYDANAVMTEFINHIIRMEHA